MLSPGSLVKLQQLHSNMYIRGMHVPADGVLLGKSVNDGVRLFASVVCLLPI